MSRDDTPDTSVDTEHALRMTTDIVASYVAANKLDPDQVPDLIRAVHRTIQGMAKGEDERIGEKLKPAVAPSKSIHDDFIICLEDGKKLKMLKRYLRSTYGMSPEEYRKRWGLPADYPMVAPNYAKKRSDFAKRIGLGKGVRRKEG
jgi:predicted transcriptional regulator